jgi:hypothetical protein
MVMVAGASLVPAPRSGPGIAELAGGAADGRRQAQQAAGLGTLTLTRPESSGGGSSAPTERIPVSARSGGGWPGGARRVCGLC